MTTKARKAPVLPLFDQGKVIEAAAHLERVAIAMSKFKAREPDGAAWNAIAALAKALAGE